MNFTTWQIERIRRGLNAYRLMRRSGNALLPWKTVLDHILRSEKTKHVHPEDGAEEGAFKQEALRRFANGQETLQPDKLEDVWLFLIEKGVLRSNEVEELGDFKEALALHGVLASRSLEGDLILSNLMTGYSAVNVGSFEEEHIELHFLSESAANLVAVEERTRYVLTHGNTPGKDHAKLGATTRRGYAFTSSPHATLHIFVRGGDLDDHVHYVSVADSLGNGRLHMLPHLLRSRPPSRISRSAALKSAEALKLAGLFAYLPDLVQDEHVERVMGALNILSFSPSNDARSLSVSRPSAAITAEAAQEMPVQAEPATQAEPSAFSLWLHGARLREMVQSMAAEEAAAFLAQGADVNVPDHNGMTALHHAAVRGARPCIRLLVASGKCDFLARDKQGRYAFELAIEWARDYAVARLLIKKQAQQAAAQGVAAYVPRT